MCLTKWLEDLLSGLIVSLPLPPPAVPYPQLALHSCVLLGLGDALLLVAVVLDALAGELGAVGRVLRALVLQGVVDVVVHWLIDRGWWWRWSSHYQV